MWFRKRYRRWGWEPVTWQGWLIFATALLDVVLASWLLDDVVMFVVVLVFIVSLFTAISWRFSR